MYHIHVYLPHNSFQITENYTICNLSDLRLHTGISFVRHPRKDYQSDLIAQCDYSIIEEIQHPKNLAFKICKGLFFPFHELSQIDHDHQVVNTNKLIR